jgi:hypothetical protein
MYGLKPVPFKTDLCRGWLKGKGPQRRCAGAAFWLNSLFKEYQVGYSKRANFFDFYLRSNQ